MEQKILIKEIDKLVSVVSQSRVVTEYIIYYIVDGNKVEAYTEFGDNAKNIRVNEMLLKHFVTDNNKITLEDIIEEVSFEELYNIKN
jgi:hypothetical protein